MVVRLVCNIRVLHFEFVSDFKIQISSEGTCQIANPFNLFLVVLKAVAPP